MSLVSVSRRARSFVTGLAGEPSFPRIRVLREDAAHHHGLCDLRVRFAGRAIDLTVRRNTTDIDLVRMILREPGMYRLPAVIDPGVVFDVGANIGIAAVYFALCYPRAEIYCFEPLPENQELLKRNTQSLDRVHVVPCGLSDRPGTFEYCMSNNPDSFGGGTFCGVGCDKSRSIRLPVSTVETAMAGLGLAQVDLFKLDTEGSEFPILRGIPEPVRAKAHAYVGELHGLGDWEFCQMLSATHDIGVEKRVGRRCFPFVAVRKDLI